VLYAYGRPLLVDYFYPHTLWGCEAESHNLIVVNGKDQRGHVKVAGAGGNPDFRGVVAGLVSTSWYARLINDASLAYEPSDVNSCVREAMYLRRAKDSDPPGYFVLFDDVDHYFVELPEKVAVFKVRQKYNFDFSQKRWRNGNW